MLRYCLFLTILTGFFSKQLQSMECDEKGWEKEQGVFLLGKQKEKTAIPLLIAMIREPDEETRIKLEAISSLSEMGGDSTHEVLVEILFDHEEFPPVVRSIAAAALGKLQDPKSVPHLVEAMKEENEPLVQWKIIEALGRIGTEQSLTIVEEYLKPDKPLRLRKTAIQTLSKTHSDYAQLVLSELLNQTDQFEIKLQLIQALGEMETDQAESSLKTYYASKRPPEIPGDKKNTMLANALHKSLKNIELRKKTP